MRKLPVLVLLAIVCGVVYVLLREGDAPALPRDAQGPAEGAAEDSTPEAATERARLSAGEQGTPHAEDERASTATARLNAVVVAVGLGSMAGIEVRLEGGADRRFSQRTDEDGRVRFEDLPTERAFDVSLWLDAQLLRMVEEPLQLQPGEDANREWSVEFTCRLHGTARFPDGRPAANKELMVYMSFFHEPRIVRPPSREHVVAREMTDEDGRFVFEAVPAGSSYLIGPYGRRARLQMGDDGTPRLVSIAEPLVPFCVPIWIEYDDVEREVDLTVHTGLSIGGVVVYPDGTPADEVLLLATPAGISGSLRADTDREGRFRFTPVLPGRYQLFANSAPTGWGFFDQPEVEAGEQELEFVLQPAGAITGRTYVAEDGSTMDTWVSAIQADGGPRPGASVSATSRAAEGRFRLENLQPAVYSLLVHSDEQDLVGFLPGVSVEGGEVTEALEIPLHPMAEAAFQASASDELTARCFLDGHRIGNVVIRPGRSIICAFPPGRLSVEVYRDGVLLEELHVVLQAGRIAEIACAGDAAQDD